MKLTQTGFEGLLIIEPKLLKDKRGHFFESYNKKSFEELGLYFDFVQDNQSWSRAGVIRGLHFQIPPVTQTKLVRVLQGSIWDVAVDLRKGEPTFGKSFCLELSAENGKQLLVPKGFAHGFSVLSDSTVVLYKSDGYYTPGLERGIRYNDKELNIDWKLSAAVVPLVSDKDLAWPTLSEIQSQF